jgi:hypothetical protein
LLCNSDWSIFDGVEGFSTQIDTSRETPLEKAVRLAGGQSALAREATKHHPRGKRLTQGMIWKWLNRTRESVPSAEWAIPIEKAVEALSPPEERITRYELRADLYPREQVVA